MDFSHGPIPPQDHNNTTVPQQLKTAIKRCLLVPGKEALFLKAVKGAVCKIFKRLKNYSNCQQNKEKITILMVMISVYCAVEISTEDARWLAPACPVQALPWYSELV